ncbi:protein phosphatase 2C domain-containing protein [Glycomyces arizonensis]|uniref:protein phosphatase 2C domain-containing protein n=1 Tax=Glycomyces arizonensis TaxID=256035 RepID=UPI0004016EB4|nr:protein phosphatase 2C domain-containing protein [Glycomyces arizonensis]
MTERQLDLAAPPPRSLWGDREPPWLPDTVGRPARAAEAAWKIDPDPAFPDSILEGGRIGDLDVLACAVRGAKHRFEGTARQDAAIARTAGQWVLAAVADGVGSVPDSQLASEAAVRAFAAELSRRLEHGEPNFAKHELGLFKDISIKLRRLGGPRTTLTAAAVEAVPNQEGNYRYWIGRVGDSPAYAIVGDDLAALFKAEREDEYATATDALPSEGIGDSFDAVTGELRPGQALMLVSDGIGDLMIADELREYFAREWRSRPGDVDFMRQVQVRRKSFDDDRSAAVLWAAPGGAPAGSTPMLKPASPRLAADPEPRDAEVSGARVQHVEVRAASRRGAIAAAQGARRSACVLLSYFHDRLVAVAAAPKLGTGPGAGAERWARKLMEIIEHWPPGPSEVDWTMSVWKGAYQSMERGPEFDPAGLTSTVVTAYPDHEGRVYYTAGVQGPLTAVKTSGGIKQGLWELPGELVARYEVDPGSSLDLYSGRLLGSQALLLGGGFDTAAMAETLVDRPGPLQLFGALERQAGPEDGYAVAMWSER